MADDLQLRPPRRHRPLHRQPARGPDVDWCRCRAPGIARLGHGLAGCAPNSHFQLIGWQPAAPDQAQSPNRDSRDGQADAAGPLGPWCLGFSLICSVLPTGTAHPAASVYAQLATPPLQMHCGKWSSTPGTRQRHKHSPPFVETDQEAAWPSVRTWMHDGSDSFGPCAHASTQEIKISINSLLQEMPTARWTQLLGTGSEKVG